MNRVVDALIFFAVVAVVFHLVDSWLPAAAAAASPAQPATTFNQRFG